MPVNTPKWLSNAVIYSIYVRNFSKEGSFNAIHKELDRIKDLGTDIVWLLPIYPIGEIKRKGSLGSPYAIKDYRKVNPELGTEEDFKNLVDAIHKKGMKVIIDIVYNHTSPDSVLAKEHPEWFYKDSSGKPAPKFPEWSDVIDLDYSKKELWDYQIETLMMWIDKGVDGFRCDVASMVPIDFWVEARNRIENKYKDKEIIWLTESVHPSFVKSLREQGFYACCDPELHRAFDLSYDYDGYQRLQDYFKGTTTLKAYYEHLYNQQTLYPDYAIKMRFLENHDNDRFININNNYLTLKNWTVFYSLLPGATLVYMGQEIVNKKWPTLFERDPIDWNDGIHEHKDFLKKVLSIAKDIKSKKGLFDLIEITGGVVALIWSTQNERYIAIVNLEDKYGIINTNLRFNGIDLISGETISITGQYRINKEPIIIKL